MGDWTCVRLLRDYEGFRLRALEGTIFAEPDRVARDYSQLRVFVLSDALIGPVYKVTGHCPPDERFGLRSQIRRAAVSVPTNIVEGSAMPTTSGYLRFLYVSLGSATEVSYPLGLGVRLGFVHETDGLRLILAYSRLISGLQRLANSLECLKPEARSRGRPKSTAPLQLTCSIDAALRAGVAAVDGAEDGRRHVTPAGEEG